MLDRLRNPCLFCHLIHLHRQFVGTYSYFLFTYSFNTIFIYCRKKKWLVCFAFAEHKGRLKLVKSFKMPKQKSGPPFFNSKCSDETRTFSKSERAFHQNFIMKITNRELKNPSGKPLSKFCACPFFFIIWWYLPSAQIPVTPFFITEAGQERGRLSSVEIFCEWKHTVR